jgi:hypothetical protein
MVEPRPVDGGLERIAVHQQIEQDLKDGGGDAAATTGTEDQPVRRRWPRPEPARTCWDVRGRWQSRPFGC